MMPTRPEQIKFLMDHQAARGQVQRYTRPNYWEAPVGSVSFDYAASIDYPAPGDPETTILSYTMQRGHRGAVRYMGIIHIGGNAPDGTGNVIWRIRINGAAYPGYANNQFQVGNANGVTFGNLADLYINLTENDVLEATVQVAAGSPLLTGLSTAARFRGFEVSSVGGVLQ